MDGLLDALQALLRLWVSLKLDWLSWAFWAEATHASLLFWTKAATWTWVRFTDNREDIVPLATLIGGMIGIYLLAIRTHAADRTARAALDQAKVAATQAKTAADRHDEQTRADRERRITESMAKAGEQLGSDKIETRLIGIYTLERIARESRREYWPIMETLTAYVREHAPLRQVVVNPFVKLQGAKTSRDPNPQGAASTNGADEEWEPPQPEQAPPTDIAAVLTVLGRRSKEQRIQDQKRLNLRADLRGAQLPSANLQGADFSLANLQRVNLTRADLEKAHFNNANLQEADLSEANLQEADLSEANLQRAYFMFANLRKAILHGADLQDAILPLANLEGAYLALPAHAGGPLFTNLQGANLRSAKLQYADLCGANLERAALLLANLHGANLENARLREAHLEGADLSKAVWLTQGQLDIAFGDDRTILPEGLTRPAHWLPATPDEPPEKPNNAE